MAKRAYKTIGMCLSQIYLEYREHIMETLCRNAALKNIKLLIFNTFVYLDANPFDAERRMFEFVNYDVLDGLIMCRDYIRNDDVVRAIIEKARSHDVPVLILDGVYDGCHSLTFDYITSFMQVVRHVFEHHKCKKVNFIAAYKGNFYSEARLACYKQVLAEQGLTFEPERVFYGDFEEKLTYSIIDEMLEKGSLPEAIICANDDMALAACDALFKKGIYVPKDVIVTGFDGCPQEKYHTPRLTTCAPDWNEVGIKVMELFEQIWSGVKNPADIVIDYNIRISQSCGCAPLEITAANYMCFENALLKKEKTNFSGRIFEVSHKLSGSSSLEELFKEIEPLMDIINCRSFRCCLKAGFISEKPIDNLSFGSVDEQEEPINDSEYCMLYCFEDGKRLQPSFFLQEELLPKINDILSDPKLNNLFFFPLCRNGEFVGYTAMDLDISVVDFGNIFNFIVALDANLGFIKQNHDMMRTLELLEYMHVHDALTDLYNRRGFYSNISKMLKRKDKDLYIVVFSIDMDDMKYINDNFGHHEGDIAIKATAQSMIKASQEFNSINARFGGDEFITVILTNNLERACEQFPHNLADSINEHNRLSAKEYAVQTSIGFAYKTIGEANAGIDDIIREADASMYTDKQKKKSNRVRSR